MSAIRERYRSGHRQFYNSASQNVMLDIGPDGVCGSFNSQGVTYYVDQTTGSDSNTGLNWDHAFEQVQAAIVASEAQRLAADNVYARNTILVAPGAAIYDNLTVLPNFTDIIGLGASPFGNGAGIVRIGAAAGAHGAAGSGGTTDMRGANFRNIQFCVGGNYYAFYAAQAFRCIFEDCAFGTPDTGAAAYGGLWILSGSGVQVINCGTVENAGALTYGMRVGNGSGGGNFSECIVEYCRFHGSTAAFYTDAYLQNSSTIRFNQMMGGTNGIKDVSSETTLAGNSMYIGNFCYGSQSTAANAGGVAVTANPTYRCVGNHCSDAGTYHLY